jgi:signal transduction histidine kinase
VLGVSLLTLALAVVSALGFRDFQTLRAFSRNPPSVPAPIGQALEAGIERLDALLLRLQLTGDPAHRDAFLSQSRDWTSRLGDARMSAGNDVAQHEALQQAAAKLTEYLETTQKWLSRTRPSMRRDTAAQLAAEIDAVSAPLRTAASALVTVENRSTEASLAQITATLAAAPRRLAITALLLIAIVAIAAVLLRRSLLTPLQQTLDRQQGAHHHRDRLAQLGTVAAGVVHEIRTPLTAIKARAHHLRRSALDGHADLTIIEDEIRRLDRILEDFLQLARPSQPRREQVPIPALLQGIHDLVRQPLSDRGIVIRLENPPDPLVLIADPGHLRQVLLNLVRNAADSLSSGGVVTLRARLGMDTRSKPASPVVMLEVADTGAGIAPEVEARLFEPFVTGKPQGTGLGLSIAAQLVEAHGGHLQYQTQSGRGTVFTVVLPRTHPASLPATNLRS